jgi:hypothetical protein
MIKTNHQDVVQDIDLYRGIVHVHVHGIEIDVRVHGTINHVIEIVNYHHIVINVTVQVGHIVINHHQDVMIADVHVQIHQQDNGHVHVVLGIHIVAVIVIDHHQYVQQVVVDLDQ